MITDKNTIESVNRKLLENYQILDGRPIYRVVWSWDQLEKRFSDKWTDWYGQILIRSEHKGVREIRKYWYMKTPCWVLEKLIFMRGQWHLKELMKELVEAQNGTYEPILPFFHEQSNKHLPVDEETVGNIVHRLHNPILKTPLDWKNLEKQEEEEEVKYFENKISEDERSPLFVWENSAFVSTNQIKHRKEMEYVEKTGAIDLPSGGINV